MTPTDFETVMKEITHRVERDFPDLRGDGGAEELVQEFLYKQLKKKGPLETMNTQSLYALLNWRLLRFRALDRAEQKRGEKRRFPSLDSEDKAKSSVVEQPRIENNVDYLVRDILRWSATKLKKRSQQEEVVRELILTLQDDWDVLSPELQMELNDLLSGIKDRSPIVNKPAKTLGLDKMRALWNRRKKQ